jgi:hypothetical protein
LRINKQFQIPLKVSRIAASIYLFLVALYFLLGAAHLVNILINLTVENNIGLYFEFINASIDRAVVYTLSFITMLYVPTKFPRKWVSLPLLFTCVSLGYFVSLQAIDALVISASFTVLARLLTGHEPFAEMSGRKTVYTIFVFLLLILIVIEILSIICWSIFPTFPTLSQEGACRSIIDLETKMFLFAGSAAPLLAVLFLFSWVIHLFSRCDFLRRCFTFLRHASNDLNDIGSENSHISFLFVCSLVFSFLVAIYPYLPGLNTDMHAIGVDIPLYRDWLLEMENGGLPSAFMKAFLKHPDRPLSLSLMYLMKYMGGLSALSVAEFFPLILAPLLVLAVYFFVREAVGSVWVPSLAAFLSVSSFHFSVGMYAGFLSNWMAIIESYLCMGFFFGYLRKKSRLKMTGTLLFSVSILFTHAGAWGMFMGILLAYLFLTFLKQKAGDHSLEIRFLLVVIFVNVLAGLLRNYVLGWSIGEIETFKSAQDEFSIGAIGSFWDDTFYTFFHTMYGFFVNPVALLLAVLGGYMIVLDDKPVNRYLTSWLVASSIFFVLTFGWGVKSRILFNIPLPIFEVFGLIGVSNITQKFFEPNRTSVIKILTILLILLVSLNYAFRCAFTMSQVVYDLFT